MTTSEQLEREAEATRARIDATLEELRSRITPGQLVDQLMDYARDGKGAAFMRNFGRQVVDNPVPVTLVGAGLAWLAMASRGRTDDGGRADFGLARTASTVGDRTAQTGEGLRDAASSAREQASAAAGRWTGSASEAAGSAEESAEEWAGQAGSAAARAREQASATTAQWTDSAREAANSARDTANQWSAQARTAASDAGARLQGTAGAAASALNEAASAAYDAAARGSRQSATLVGRTAAKVGENMSTGGQSLMDFFNEQPLFLAGIGLALGAVLGAALPGTETEDRLMGGASDAAKSEAKERAQHQLDKGKAVAQEGWNAISRELEHELQHGGGEAERESSAQAPVTDQKAGDQASLVPSHEDELAEAESHGSRGDREPRIE